MFSFRIPSYLVCDIFPRTDKIIYWNFTLKGHFSGKLIGLIMRYCWLTKEISVKFCWCSCNKQQKKILATTYLRNSSLSLYGWRLLSWNQLVKKNDFISRILGLFKKINSRSQRGEYFIRFLYFCYRKPSQCCIFFKYISPPVVVWKRLRNSHPTWTRHQYSKCYRRGFLSGFSEAVWLHVDWLICDFQH